MISAVLSMHRKYAKKDYASRSRCNHVLSQLVGAVCLFVCLFLAFSRHIFLFVGDTGIVFVVVSVIWWLLLCLGYRSVALCVPCPCDRFEPGGFDSVKRHVCRFAISPTVSVMTPCACVIPLSLLVRLFAVLYTLS